MQYWRYELERFYQACMALHGHTGDGSKGAMIHIALFIRKKKYDGTRSYVRVPHIEDFGGSQGDVWGGVPALRRLSPRGAVVLLGLTHRHFGLPVFSGPGWRGEGGEGPWKSAAALGGGAKLLGSTFHPSSPL